MPGLRCTLLVLLVSGAPCLSVSAEAQRFTVPRTENGHPDLQGMWSTEFVTMLERMPGMESLVATPEQAPALGAGIFAKLPPVIDPDVHLLNVNQLALVKGEHRTSIIVEPRDGRLPFTKAGRELAERIARRHNEQFDHPEERPLAERCLENLVYPPIRTVPVFLPRQIIQTRDHVVIWAEDVPGVRIIHLGEESPTPVLASLAGFSRGRWEGDTLVVETTHVRTDDPARTTVGPRPLLLTPRSKITERFTRVSASELFYRYTVEDSELYTQPWSGEFSMRRFDGRMFEYACHEGNYSLPNSLLGGKAVEPVHGF